MLESANVYTINDSLHVDMDVVQIILGSPRRLNVRDPRQVRGSQHGAKLIAKQCTQAQDFLTFIAIHNVNEALTRLELTTSYELLGKRQTASKYR